MRPRVTSHLILIYTVCHSLLGFWFPPLFARISRAQSHRWKSPLQKLRSERINNNKKKKMPFYTSIIKGSKSPGSATFTSHSQSVTLRGRGKRHRPTRVKQTNIRKAQRPALASLSEVIAILKGLKKHKARLNINCLVELTLKVPRKTASENVVCLCRLLDILADFSNLFLHTGKQCGPWSDCSKRSSLIWVHTVCKNDF